MFYILHATFPVFCHLSTKNCQQKKSTPYRNKRCTLENYLLKENYTFYLSGQLSKTTCCFTREKAGEALIAFVSTKIDDRH